MPVYGGSIEDKLINDNAQKQQQSLAEFLTQKLKGQQVQDQRAIDVSEMERLSKEDPSVGYKVGDASREIGKSTIEKEPFNPRMALDTIDAIDKDSFLD